jgi:hypothetical protein
VEATQWPAIESHILKCEMAGSRFKRINNSHLQYTFAYVVSDMSREATIDVGGKIRNPEKPTYPSPEVTEAKIRK